MRVRVKVPATTANIGPGFDCLGMALALYNEVEFLVEGAPEPAVHTGERVGADGEASAGTPVVRLLSCGRPHDTIPLPKNLVYQSFSRTLAAIRLRVSSVTLDALRTEIPVARGLGSSAACIVGGVLAARKVAEELGHCRMTFQEAMDLAVEMEGHPDNVVPAMVGGMTAALSVPRPAGLAAPGEADEGRLQTLYARINIPGGLIFAALIPKFRMSTEEARRALPETYGRADTVFNIGRTALLVASFASGDMSYLRTAACDRVHQPYRLRLIPSSEEVIKAARESGAAAEFLSGSGPTVMAIVPGDGTRFAEEVSRRLADIPGGWTVHLLKPDMSGAEVQVV